MYILTRYTIKIPEKVIGDERCWNFKDGIYSIVLKIHD